MYRLPKTLHRSVLNGRTILVLAGKIDNTNTILGQKTAFFICIVCFMYYIMYPCCLRIAFLYSNRGKLMENSSRSFRHMSPVLWLVLLFAVVVVGVCLFSYYRYAARPPSEDAFLHETTSNSESSSGQNSATEPFVSEATFPITSVQSLDNLNESENFREPSDEIDISSESRESSPEIPFAYPWLGEGELLIAHAFGEYAHCSGTNSKEALEYNYERGFRVFECDFLFLGDQVAILHDEARGTKQTGLAAGYSYDDYMNASIYGRCSPLAVEELFQFMSSHPDMYLISDSKYADEPESSAIISAIVDIANKVDASVLERVVVQIYNEAMLESILKIYPFRSVIYTMYQTDSTVQEVADFCCEHGIQAVTFSYKRVNECLAIMKESGLVSLIHTVNNSRDAARFFQMGVFGIYTDSLEPMP